jgi:hypothetical protein
MMFFLTLFVQNPLILGWSPLKSGFAFLPVSATIVVVAGLVSRYLIKVGPKPFAVAGAVLLTGGLFWLAQLNESSTYLSGVLGPIIVFAAGMGCLFVPLTVTAVSGVDHNESGAASALLNVMQQVGGSLGLAILVTVFATSLRNEMTKMAQQMHIPLGQLQQMAAAAQNGSAGKLSPQAAKLGGHVFAHAISTAFEMGIVFAGLALLLTIVAIKTSKQDVDQEALQGGLAA